MGDTLSCCPELWNLTGKAGVPFEERETRIIIDFYRHCVREDYLDHIACWGESDSFIRNGNEMANRLGISPTEASALLRSAYLDVWNRAKGTGRCLIVR